MTTVSVVGLLESSLVATLYVGIVVGHTVLQRRYARQHASRPLAPRSWTPRPTIDVIVPVLNEAPHLLRQCCEALRGQDYQPIRVFLVDDRSDNIEDLRPLYERYGDLPGWTFVPLERRGGKRDAQDAAYRLGSGEFVLTVDSDTVIEPDTIRRLMDEIEDDRVGAVTGNVRALNQADGLLTRLINWRYALLFDLERAAHGRHRAVLCCTGPLSLYQRDALVEVWDAYLRQTFLNRRCVFGDDLQLTNLLLAKGYEARYAPDARALTEVPTRLRGYFRQQLRWNRSFYRELPWTRRALRGHRQGPKASWYLWFDVIARGLTPLLLAASLARVGVDAVMARSWLLADGAMLMFMIVSSSVVAFWQTRSLPSSPDRPASRHEALRLVLLYGLVHVILLVPARVWALVSLRRNGWGTRRVPAPAVAPAPAL